MEHVRHKDRLLKHIISSPFIYWAWIGLVLLDVFIEIYHRICFPLYWLELVGRKKYFQFKRHKLPYLSNIQKFNCAYCSYGNWLMKYATEIIAQTEKYWCGIQNEKQNNLLNPSHHKDFLPYWDEKAFIEKFWEQNIDCKLFNK